MKKQDIMSCLWYVIMIVLIVNLIFTVTSIRVMHRVLEEMDGEHSVHTTAVYAYPMKIDTEPVQDAPSEPVEAPEPEIVPEVEYFDVPLDEDLQEYIFAVCDTYGVEPELIISMIYRESKYDAGAIGDGGKSLGLMQIQPRWHSERMAELGCDDLLNPYQNVEVGIDLMDELLNKRGSVEWALMAYNGGPSYANDMIKAGKVSEYARDVIAMAEELSR